MKTKAILVIDEMPECCFACPCYDRSDYADGCLAIDGGRRSTSHAPWARREGWCPLKPIIDGIPEDECDAYVRGFTDGILNMVDDEEIEK